MLASFGLALKQDFNGQGIAGFIHFVITQTI
jgi:hypothetical protein